MANVESLFEIEKAVFVGIEATYGTDILPTAGTDVLLTEEFKLEAANVEKQTRNIDRLGLGGTEDAIGAMSAKVSFKVPLTGSGTAGEAAAYSTTIRAHQFNTVLSAGTSCTHNLVSSSVESASIYFYKGDRLRKLLGYRGSAGFMFKKGEIAYLVCDGMALYAEGEDGEQPPAPNLTTTQTPIVVTNKNTPVFTFGGTALALMSLDISPPGNVKHRDVPNQEEVRISDRRNYSGKLTVLQRTLANFDPESLMKNHTLSALVLQHGVAAGDIVELTAGQVQIVGVSEGVDEGDATWELDLNIVATGSGDDDLKLVLK